jgi:hypothetical protein
MTPEDLGQAIGKHVESQYADESYDHESGEVTYYDHTCNSACAYDILPRLDAIRVAPSDGLREAIDALPVLEVAVEDGGDSYLMVGKHAVLDLLDEHAARVAPSDGLRAWLRHADWCGYHRAERPHEWVGGCTCGLRAALATTGQPEPTEPDPSETLPHPYRAPVVIDGHEYRHTSDCEWTVIAASEAPVGRDPDMDYERRDAMLAVAFRASEAPVDPRPEHRTAGPTFASEAPVGLDTYAKRLRAAHPDKWWTALPDYTPARLTVERLPDIIDSHTGKPIPRWRPVDGAPYEAASEAPVGPDTFAHGGCSTCQMEPGIYARLGQEGGTE